LLTSYNGTAITYDGMGNPLSYYNGVSYTFSWDGRNLVGATLGSNTYTFTYNDQGQRVTKTKNDVTTRYYWSGSLLLAEETDGNVYIYLYDEQGSPIGFQYRAANYSETAVDTYWYEKNLQGDIVAVYNSSGTKLVSYTYTAYGECMPKYSNGGNSTAAANNPMRYRGYYYDTDLQLYYLISRYYDARMGRFISADLPDVLTATPMGFTDKNLYAYCDNNPVMRVDEDGEFWNFIIGGVVGAIAGGVVAALNGEDLAGIIIGTFAGAASGVVAATGLGLFAQAGVSAGISALADFANQTVDILLNGGTFADYNVGQTLIEAGLGFATSVAGGLAGKFFDDNITKNFVKSKGLFDKYLSKTFTAGLRKEVGKSTSALIRQANKLLKQSNFYLNAYRGVSSVVGSVVSLWNIAR